MICLWGKERKSDKVICLWGKREKVKADYLPERLRMKVITHDLLVEQRQKVAGRLLKFLSCKKRKKKRVRK